MSTEQEFLAAINASVDKVAAAIAHLDASISASNSSNIVNILAALAAAIAALITAYFALVSIQQQRKIEIIKYKQTMHARNSSDIMQKHINDFDNWINENKLFIENIKKSWREYQNTKEESNIYKTNFDEQKKMKEIGPQSATIYHFFEEIYSNYKGDFLNLGKSDIFNFKKLRAYGLLQDIKHFSMQLQKDVDGEKNVKSIEDKHKWIDELNKA
jgi:hypothetical protein